MLRILRIPWVSRLEGDLNARSCLRRTAPAQLRSVSCFSSAGPILRLTEHLSRNGTISRALVALTASSNRLPNHPSVACASRKVASPICGLDLVADSMGESHLDKLSGIRSRLRRPVAERGAEAVSR